MAVEQFPKIENGAIKVGSSFDPTNVPTTDQSAALAGTSGTPGAGNRYVTDTDPRLVGSSVNESNGPYKMVHYGAVPQSFTGFIFDSDSNFDSFEMPNNGSIVRAVIRTSNPRTAGQLQAKISKNGIPLVGALDMVLDGTTPESDQKSVAPGTTPYTFAAGDRIGVQFVSDGAWSPDVGGAIIVSVDFYVTFN